MNRVRRHFHGEVWDWLQFLGFIFIIGFVFGAGFEAGRWLMS